MENNSTRKLSPLEKEFAKFDEKYARKRFSAPIDTFDDNSKAARDKRVEKAIEDFLYFDETYFPKSMFRQGWYPPGFLHFTMLQKTLEKGIHWFGAHRSLAKSVYLLKIRLWWFLSGKANSGGIVKENKSKSMKFVRAMANVIRTNGRLKADFGITIDTLNDDILVFKCNTNDGYCSYVPYSLDAGARGDSQVDLERLDFIDGDDLETTKQKFSEESNQKKLLKIREAYRSARDNASMIILGNNLHPKCLFNKLKINQEKGVTSDLIEILAFPAWSNKRTAAVDYLGSVWYKKYPAESEEEMREMMNVDGDVEWAEAKCEPILKSGHVFPAQYLKTYFENELPADAFGPAFCDPNLSQKGLGDTTGMGAILYSRTNDLYYVYKPRCLSFSSSNDLLTEYLKMFDGKIRLMAMDGNVSQESNWANNIRNFVAIKGVPMPPIMFCKYNVDMISLHLSSIYKQGKLRFPAEYLQTDEGITAMEQFHTFGSKKESGKDDFPDCLISCYQFAIENGMFIPNALTGGNAFDVTSIGFGGSF